MRNLEFKIEKETEKAYLLTGYIQNNITDATKVWEFWVPKSHSTTREVEIGTLVTPADWLLKKQLQKAEGYYGRNIILLNTFQDASFN